MKKMKGVGFWVWVVMLWWWCGGDEAVVGLGQWDEWGGGGVVVVDE